MNLRRIPKPVQFFGTGVLVGLVIGVAFASVLRWFLVIGVIILIALAVLYIQQFFARQKG
jgi:uncharacterized membrane protein (Fun14 family)